MLGIPAARLAALAIVVASAFGCAPDSAPDLDDDLETIDATEDELAEPGFDRSRVLSDVALTDAGSMTQAEIQAFLDKTPYGNKSALASYSSGGLKASAAIAKAASDHGINPLAILVRAQMEQSLIGKTTASKKALDFAFGCGCPDGKSCSETWRGFHKQADCMASHMRSYMEDLEAGGSTIAGWKVDKSKKTLDGLFVTPKNAATAALYTYTPWVGSSGFGNVAHFKIWRRFASHVGYAPLGAGGCAPITFPSGMVVETFPSDAMTEAYLSKLGPLGLDDAPSCFLDPEQLVDPSTGGVWSKSTQVATNFVFSELMGASGARQVLVDPVLVSKLQAMRTSIGKPISVAESFRSPEDHLAACDACEDTLAMTLGEAAFVSSSAGAQKLLDAAKAAGVPTCWAEGSRVYLDVGAASLGCPIASP